MHRREQVNSLIVEAAEHILDFNYLMGTYNSILWISDGLHFSKAGYKKMAEIIYNTLKAI